MSAGPGAVKRFMFKETKFCTTGSSTRPSGGQVTVLQVRSGETGNWLELLVMDWI